MTISDKYALFSAKSLQSSNSKKKKDKPKDKEKKDKPFKPKKNLSKVDSKKHGKFGKSGSHVPPMSLPEPQPQPATPSASSTSHLSPRNPPPSTGPSPVLAHGIPDSQPPGYYYPNAAFPLPAPPPGYYYPPYPYYTIDSDAGIPTSNSRPPVDEKSRFYQPPQPTTNQPPNPNVSNQ